MRSSQGETDRTRILELCQKKGKAVDNDISSYQCLWLLWNFFSTKVVRPSRKTNIKIREVANLTFVKITILYNYSSSKEKGWTTENVAQQHTTLYLYSYLNVLIKMIVLTGCISKRTLRLLKDGWGGLYQFFEIFPTPRAY